MKRRNLELVIITLGVLLVVVSILFTEGIWLIFGVIIGILVAGLHQEIAKALTKK